VQRSMGPAVRKAAVAGSWYPGKAAAVVSAVEGYLAEAGPLSVAGRLVALLCPHAGLRYSGPVAAYGYSLLRGRSPLTVVLVGPSHHARFDGVALWATGAFETPLGRAPIDEALARALLDADPSVRDLPEVHREEHSLEVQMPFLQHLVPGLRLVPMLMGTQSRPEVDALAAALGSVLAGEKDVLLVASSDLSHYQSEPVAHELDAVVADCVDRFDAEGLMRRLETSRGHACGGGPLVAVMKAARSLGADRASVLRYATSGDVGERDKTRVVGYLSAALTASA
jgi:AmmeMemoRadiSam system protein B